MWFTPDLTLCKTRLTAPEWSSLSSAAKASGQVADDMAGEVITTQVTRIRGRMPRHVKLGAEGTIPDELRGSFLALWVYEFISRLPQMKRFLDEFRVKNWEAANAELEDLANGKINVVPPTEAAPDNEQAAGPGVEVARAARTPQDLSGLF